MQSENQALWSEIGSLRQKHSKQQQIVSKLMEFLLQFISTNSSPSNGQSVEQQESKDVLLSDSLHPQQAQTQHHTNNSPLMSNEHDSSLNTLKRKQVALMHSDEPNKRIHVQQHHHQQFSNPPNLDRQQSVTINELPDNDTSGWHHTTNASPLIDLVPSPPPPTHSTDDNYHQQQNDYRWTTSTNELLHPSGHDQKHLIQQNKTFRTVGNGDNAANTYVPDFFLRTDNTNGVNKNIGHETSSTGIKTVTIDTECYIAII
jgi:hypothetical protein